MASEAEMMSVVGLGLSVSLFVDMQGDIIHLVKVMKELNKAVEELRNEVNGLKAEVDGLRNELGEVKETLGYVPDGPGYEQAKSHFESVAEGL